MAKDIQRLNRECVTEEVRFSIKKSKGELEQILFDKELCTILSIIPLQIPIQNLFKELICECNQYGNFLEPDYIITNVKILSNDQIRKLIKLNQSRNKTRKS